MIISTSSADPSKTKLDVLLIVTPAFESKSSPYQSLGHSLSKICVDADPKKLFRGKEGAIFIFPTFHRVTPTLIALVGTGKSIESAVYHRCIGKAIKQFYKFGIKVSFSVGITFVLKRLPVQTVIQAIEEASYNFHSYIPLSEEKSRPPISRVILFSKSISDREIHRANSISSAVRYSRELGNQPGNHFTPSTFSTEAQKLARRHRLQCKIWDVPQLKRDGFGGILAVGQGSANSPRLIRLDYRGEKKAQAPYVIIGKAITFDSGGISIKPSEKMDQMKFDKCGGIAVLGIMDAIARLRLPIHVVGLISSAENMPSSKAYRPGDLIQSLSGKYIEIMNTDAEGRIVLADALTYAQRLKPRAMVDIATLTGACVICFGHECAAILGNQNSLIEELRRASEKTSEKIWPLPLWQEYQEKVKSDIAYVKNSAGREGGAITAACFLNAFVDGKVPWAHIDIAGVAWTDQEESYRAKGATAFGVRLITQWLESKAKNIS